MIEIDGSYGEGGGQILRSSLSLSILTGKACIIKNIRANRPNPGLRAQHLTAVRVAMEVSNADVKGLEIGSKRLEFHPGDIEEGRYHFDIGTAGSVTLVLQTILPISFLISRPIELSLRGGTDVKWSPTWDYFVNVYLPIISKIGVDVEAEILRRGFYPSGGGEVRARINPLKWYSPLNLDEQDYQDVEGVITVSKLGEDIPRRIKHSIIDYLIRKGVSARIKVDRDDTSISEGVSVTLWSCGKDSRVGSAHVGEKGLPSEKLGRLSADDILKEIESRASLDVHMADQVLIYLAYPSAHHQRFSRFLVREITNHARTNAWLVERFLPVRISMERKERLYEVQIRGI